jgi:hypothetical protein
MQVHAAKDEAKSSVGDMPVFLPPKSIGSSAIKEFVSDEI